MFLTVTRRVCHNTLLNLECPRDHLLDVYDISMGTLDLVSCLPLGHSTHTCEVTKPSDQNNIVNITLSCQNERQCEIPFPFMSSVTMTDSEGEEFKCFLATLSLTYNCVSKYCIEINKSLQLLPFLAVSANTKKALNGTIPNVLYRR